MQEWKKQEQIAGVENAGVENARVVAGVQNAGVSRMEHQTEIILIES